MNHPTSTAIPSQIEERVSRSGITRAFIVGTRITVADVFISHDMHGHSPEEIVAVDYPHLTLGQVHAALAYFYDHAEEIREQLRQEQDYAERIKEQAGPGLLDERRSERAQENGSSAF